MKFKAGGQSLSRQLDFGDGFIVQWGVSTSHNRIFATVNGKASITNPPLIIVACSGRTVEHLKKELQQKGDIGLVAEVQTLYICHVT